MNQDEIVLLLVGRTGNGKSSTGNSILGKEVPAFKTRAAWEKAIHDTPARGETGSLVVVDGSGIGDTGEDLIGGESAAIKSCDMAFELCGMFFTAIILVLKYGVRFTKQEKDAVQMIKCLFGEDVLKRWGIIVMTYGDNFEKDQFEMGNLEEDKTELFQSWCNKQGGDFKSFYEECNKRCVLFNNKTNAEQMKNQVLAVHGELQKLKLCPYTEDDYNQAIKNRPKLYPQNNSKGKENDDYIEDLMDNVKRFIEDGNGNYYQLSADLEKAILQQKDEAVVYQINVLIQELRKTQGLCESICANMNLAYLFLHQNIQRFASWLVQG